MIVTQLLREMLQVRESLEAHGIRGTGGYAELLAAKALGATRNLSGVEKGYDLICSKLGRVEVRSRTLPRSGRKETRIEIPSQKSDGFDWLLGILFNPDVSIVGGFLLPHDATLRLAELQQFKRIPFEVGAAHPEAVNMTAKLREAQLSL